MKSTEIQRIAAEEYATSDDGLMKEVVDAGHDQQITYDLLIGEVGDTLSAFIYGEAQSADDLPDLVRMLRNGARDLASLADRLEARQA